MKIEKLASGMIIKNYKELCLILEIEPKKTGSNSYKSQIKELERHFKYHKEGHKFIIDEVYPRELEKLDKRKLGNNNEQAQSIRYLMCNLLSKHEIEQDEVIGFSKYQLLKQIYMVNENYTIAKGFREKYATAMGVSKIAIDECFDYLEHASINSITRAINVLRQQSVLGYKYSFTWIDDKGKHHHCNTIEENIIHNAEQKIMEEINIRNKQLIWNFGRWKEFKTKVMRIIKENNILDLNSMTYYYSSFHFNYNNEGILKHMKYMETKQGMILCEAVEKVQSLWSDSLDKTIENRYEKYISVNIGKLGFGEHVAYKTSDKYVTEQKKIKNSIIDISINKVNLKEIDEKIDEDIPF